MPRIIILSVCTHNRILGDFLEGNRQITPRPFLFYYFADDQNLVSPHVHVFLWNVSRNILSVYAQSVFEIQIDGRIACCNAHNELFNSNESMTLLAYSF